MDSNQHRPEVRTMSHGAQGLRDATCQVDICRHDARQGGSTAPRGQTPQGVLRMQPVVRELLRAAKPVRVDVNEAGRHQVGAVRDLVNVSVWRHRCDSISLDGDEQRDLGEASVRQDNSFAADEHRGKGADGYSLLPARACTACSTACGSSACDVACLRAWAAAEACRATET